MSEQLANTGDSRQIFDEIFQEANRRYKNDEIPDEIKELIWERMKAEDEENARFNGISETEAKVIWNSTSELEKEVCTFIPNVRRHHEIIAFSMEMMIEMIKFEKRINKREEREIEAAFPHLLELGIFKQYDIDVAVEFLRYLITNRNHKPKSPFALNFTAEEKEYSSKHVDFTSSLRNIVNQSNNDQDHHFYKLRMQFAPFIDFRMPEI